MMNGIILVAILWLWFLSSSYNRIFAACNNPSLPHFKIPVEAFLTHYHNEYENMSLTIETDCPLQDDSIRHGELANVLTSITCLYKDKFSCQLQNHQVQTKDPCIRSQYWMVHHLKRGYSLAGLFVEKWTCLPEVVLGKITQLYGHIFLYYSLFMHLTVRFHSVLKTLVIFSLFKVTSQCKFGTGSPHSNPYEIPCVTISLCDFYTKVNNWIVSQKLSPC